MSVNFGNDHPGCWDKQLSVTQNGILLEVNPTPSKAASSFFKIEARLARTVLGFLPKLDVMRKAADISTSGEISLKTTYEPATFQEGLKAIFYTIENLNIAKETEDRDPITLRGDWFLGVLVASQTAHVELVTESLVRPAATIQGVYHQEPPLWQPTKLTYRSDLEAISSIAKDAQERFDQQRYKEIVEATQQALSR